MRTRENVHLTILRQRILIRRQNSPVKCSAAKMCTNRVFVRPTPCILHTHCILHTVVLAKPVVLQLSFDWQIWSDWLWRFCTRHFQIRICRGTKPVSSGSPFIFILYSLQLFRLSKEVHTISPSNIAVHVNCTQATLVQLTKFLQVLVFHSRFILHSPFKSVSYCTQQIKNGTKTLITS